MPEKTMYSRNNEGVSIASIVSEALSDKAARPGKTDGRNRNGNQGGKRRSPHNIPLTVTELQQIRDEMKDQNPWRAKADKENDYYDCNQLSAPVLRRLEDRGVPPAQEPLIHVAINAILGVEAKTRTDFIVLDDEMPSPGLDQEKLLDEMSVADKRTKALGQRLKKTETRSGCDRACTAGSEELLKTGAGWVEISREKNPFKHPIRVLPVHRNEMWWDMSDPQDRLLERAKWVVREKRVVVDKHNKAFFTNLLRKKYPIEDLLSDIGESSLIDSDDYEGLSLNGVWAGDRGYAIEEEHLYKLNQGKSVLLTEVLYRRWAETDLVRLPDGEVAEYDPKNKEHAGGERFRAVTSRVRQAWCVGDTIISDGFSPVFRDEFHYVPFFGYIEDRTGTPYGLVRSMIYLQDEINSRTSKMQWLLSAIRSIRPDGMFLADDDVFRDEVGRSDGDLVFDPEFVEQYPAAAKMLSIEFMRDLTQEQYNRLQDARKALFSVVGITPGFLGETTGAIESGSGYNQMIEQTTQVLAKPFDFMNNARRHVGKLLLRLEAENIQENEPVMIRNEFGEDSIIILNQRDPKDNRLTNNVQRHTLHVELADVPTTPTFRSQQLISMTEVVKSASDADKQAMYPRLLSFMQVPDRADMIRELLENRKQPTSEEIEEQVQARVEQEVQAKMIDLKIEELKLKQRELDIKEAESGAKIEKTDAETDKLTAEAVNVRSDGLYSNVQTAREIVVTPDIVPIADELHKSAGGEDLNAAPVFSVPAGGALGAVESPAQGVAQNTSPQFPPRTSGQRAAEPAAVTPGRAAQPSQPGSPMSGVERAGAEPVAEVENA